MPDRDELERKMRQHHQVVACEPVSFAAENGRIYPKGTPKYERLLAEAREVRPDLLRGDHAR